MLGFFNKEKIVAVAQKEILELWEQEKKSIEQRKKECELIELKMKLGKLVISVSNEIDNVKVGVAKDIMFISQAQQPYLVLTDILTGKDFFPMGTLWDYSEQKFNALNKLEPNERISIVYNKLGYHHVDKSHTQTLIPEDAEAWGAKIKAAVEKWKAENKENWKDMNSED